MTREPREQLIVDLLTDEWNAANTHNLKPSILYDREDEPPTPSVTVEQYTEGPLGGGSTGYDAMSATGSNPHQTRSGSVPVHLYATDNELGGASTDSAKVYMTGSGGTGGVVDEVQRIVQENANRPSNPSTGNTPVDLISPTSFGPAPTDEAGRVHFAGEVLYLYFSP